ADDPGRRDARVCGAAAPAAVLRCRHRLEAPAVTSRRTLADREDVLGSVMLAPALGYVILLVGVPFVLAIALSFSNATAGSLSFQWSGLGNYATILGDPIFLRALRNSVVVTVGTQLLVIILVQAWRIFPFATVIVLAGLASIPQEIIEASIVDGAGFWRRLFQVELPLLLPVVAVAVLFGVVYTATDLGVVYILTGGGPANTTHVLP